jgi:hypothetical protein
MPITKLQLKPGINKEGTTYSNEGGYFNCNLIRFRSGYAEKLGGWISLAVGFKGVASSAWNWITYDSSDLMAIGTNQKYYIENNSTFHDITPVRDTTVISNPFTTTLGSKTVQVNDLSHGATVGAFVIFSGTTTIDGINLNGEFEIVNVLDSDDYIIATPTAATGSSSSVGGIAVTATYLLNPGNTTYTTGSGWGIPAWGFGTWAAGGTVPVAGVPPRLWSQDIFEQDLLLAYTYGNIYYWAKDTTNYNRAVTLQSYIDNDAPPKVTLSAALGDITFASASYTVTVSTTDGIVRGAKVVGSGIQDNTYVDINWDFGTAVLLTQQTVSPSTGLYTFSHAGQHAPNRTNYIVASDTSHFTIALGSKPYDPTNFNPGYDPMLVRWSDQEDPYEWVPEATNQSGEQHLSNGSVLVCAQNSRQEILLWSDTAIYSMQYIGAPYVWNFTLIGDNTSIISSNAAIAVNTITYWMGVDKFYQYSGRLETLSCTIWKYVYENLNRSQAHQVVCGSNEGFSEIWWFYPSTNSLVNDSYVIYNYLEQTWYYGSLPRSMWLDSPLRRYPMGVFSIQNSYLATAIGATDTTIKLVDAQTYPNAGTVIIDNEYIEYAGKNGTQLLNCVRGADDLNGAPTTAVVHALFAPVAYKVPNQIMYHENGCDDQSLGSAHAMPIAAFLESSDFDIGDGNNFGFLWRILPDLTFRGSTVDSPYVSLSVKSRINSGAAYTTAFTDPTNVTRTSTIGITPEEFTGQVYIRTRGRQAAFRVESDSVGTAWQVGAMRIDVRQDGRR